MKKVVLFVAAALMLSGCVESNSEQDVCTNGQLGPNGTCVCNPGYATDLVTGACVPANTEPGSECGYGQMVNGSCTCNAGYKLDAEGKCTVVDTQPGPGPSDPTKCQVTFQYVNKYTCQATGGERDWNVYLFGEMNNWVPADGNSLMNADASCTRSITIDIQKGQQLKYKFYVDGWGDDSYKADPNAVVDHDGNNQINGECGATYKYVEVAPGDNPDPGPGPTPGECLTTFKYYNAYTNTGSGGAADFKVHLVGEFNGWEKNDSNYTMNSDGNGCHTIQVKFDEGSSTKYKFHVEGWENQETGNDDGWMSDPYNTEYDNDGNSNAYIASCGMTFGGCPNSGGPVTPQPPVCQGDSCNPTPTVCEGAGGNATINVSNANAKVNSIKVDGLNITIDLKGSPSNVSGGVNPQTNGNTITDTVPENGKYTYFANVDGQEIYIPVWVECSQFDWHDAVLYFAFTDRFVNGDPSNDGKSGTSHDESDWYGGDFKGMTQKVNEGYFDKLGVNTLWISSVSMNTQKVSWGTGNDSMHSYSAYHSYWPISAFMTDYNKGDFGDIKAIEPHFGNEADLKALVDACHKRGIRVLVDFAANHVHTDSPMLSKHPDWFNDSGSPRLCDDNNNWDNYSEKCWFSKDLPDINYENGDARKTMVDHAIWLIKATNIDGFRVDAVKHMNIQFIKDLRAAVEQLYANSGIMFYMVGETFTGDMNLLNKYIGDDLLHAQFDFPLYFKIGNVLRGHGLYDAIYNGQSGYKAGFKSDLMGTFMGNHDVARAISVAAGQNEGKWGHNDTPTDWNAYNRMMAAWMILLTQPGVPLIYYGDEFGMAGSNDPDNRRMMMFGDQLNEQQKAMLGLVQSVANIRRGHKALSRGERQMMSVPMGVSDNTTVCYKMSYNGESIIVGIGMEASGAGIGRCTLDNNYNLKNLFDGSETTTSELDLSQNKFQLWLVK